MTQETSPNPHPLKEREFSSIESWEEWTRLWAETQQVEILHSLLHFGFGFSVRDSEEAEQRVCTYLQIADGHDTMMPWLSDSNANALSTRHDPRIVLGRKVSSASDLKRLLARKAFEVLCLNFFKNTAEGNYSAPSWARLVATPQVLKEIFSFFRMEDARNIRNLIFYNLPSYPEDHHAAIARNFIFDLCKFSWDCETNSRWYKNEISSDMIATLKEAQPDMVTLLCGLGEAHILLYSAYEPDESCVQRLEELALNYEIFLPSAPDWNNDFRRPSDLDEALLGRSPAAEVLLVLQRSEVARKRLDEARRLMRTRNEAEEGLRQLGQSDQ